MGKPIVAIVGRPNTGKSSFFNYITGRRISITDDTPGVTRDRIYADAEWRNQHFTLIDTGGIEPYSEDVILKQMKDQAEVAIETADIILFMVDAKDGLTAADREVASLLRKSGKSVLVIVNKVDNPENPPYSIYEFHELAMGELHMISSAHGLGIGDLLDTVVDLFPENAAAEDEIDLIKVAIVGKPNVGKSSLVNRILGEERVIVSDIPGTTRDAIDNTYEKDGQKYVFIDTAGMRRKSRIGDSIERYSVIRALAAIDRCDVCVVMIDAVSGVSEQDSKIAGYAHDQGKAIVVAVNKWDVPAKETGTLEEFKKRVYEELPFMTYAPVIFISALTGQRVPKLFDMVKYVYDQSSKRITTGMLNDVLSEAVAMVQPPSDKGRVLKVFYITQTSVKPPVFILFVNSAKLMHFSYIRYIENKLRESFGFEGTSLKFTLRER